MALDYDQVDVSTGLSTATRLNTELEKIQTALQDGLSRSGNGPNAMAADLDMGDFDILNAGAVQCDSITVGGEQIASVTALAAEADRAETAATAAEAAQAAAEAAAASVDLPLITGGDAGKAIVVNGTEDGYEYSAVVDADTAITARITDQATAEAGADNTELMTPLRTTQAVAAQVIAGDYRATETQDGTVQITLDATSPLTGFAAVDGSDDYTVITETALRVAIGSLVGSASIRLDNKLIQWGREARTGSTTTVTFPTAYDSTPGLIMVTAESTSNSIISNEGNIGDTKSSTGFTIRSGTDPTHFYWFAIGTKAGAHS